MVRQILSISALLFGMVFLMAAGGLHGILIPVRGQLEGFTTLQIGLIGTGWAIGFTAGCIFVPYVVRRAGHVRTFSTLTAMLATNILLNAMVPDAPFWVILRAVAGFCFSGCYMVAESWLNERVTNENRGMMFSVYMVVSQAAMMAGQYMLVAANPARETLFMVGAILYALAVMPTAVSKAQSPAPLTSVNLNLLELFRRSPAAAVGSILSGIISSAWTNFAPVFGQQAGLSQAGIASLLAVAMTGAIFFQLPLGRLSDRMDRRYAMAIAGAIGAIFGTILSWLAAYSSYGGIFYICIAFYGGVIYSIYSLNVAHANDYADPSDFVKVSSGLLILYGAGTMIGPLFTAQMMDWLGTSGVFTTTTLAHVSFAVYALYRTFRRAAPKEHERMDYQGVYGRTQTPETYALDPRSDAETYLDDGSTDPAPLPPVKVE